MGDNRLLLEVFDENRVVSERNHMCNCCVIEVNVSNSDLVCLATSAQAGSFSAKH